LLFNTNSGFAKTFVPYWHSRTPTRFPQRPAQSATGASKESGVFERTPSRVRSTFMSQDNVPHFNYGSTAYHSMRRCRTDSHVVNYCVLIDHQLERSTFSFFLSQNEIVILGRPVSCRAAANRRMHSSQCSQREESPDGCQCHCQCDPSK
jgi:hypothetical protein